jgi:adenine-specific DNA-methyltransferase
LAVRLEWEGKPTQVERLALPFQTVETINESRATRERDTGALFGGTAAPHDARNLLVWGDNKLVMSSLLSEYAGKVKLVYIDPPFDTGADFSLRMRVGDADFTKAPSLLEEHAYRDTWGQGRQSYLRMLYERIVLMHELLTDDGTLYVHIGPAVSHYVKVLCDEVFGESNFRGELVWKRSDAHSDAGQGAKHYGRIHEVILQYSKSDAYTFNTQYLPLPAETADRWYRHVDEDTGRRYNKADITGPGGEAKGNPRYEVFGVTRYWRYSKERMEQLIKDGLVVQGNPGTVPYRKRYLDESTGVPLQDIWTDVPMLRGFASGSERTGYPTQKPEQLIERMVRTSSNEGDLVADFFAGSGTTLAVAERLGRRWMGCDLGRFAIHTTRKRLLSVPDCKPFDIKNLGAYERQRWQVETGNGALRAYLDTILAFYHADPVEGFAQLHGRKAGRMVHVGATDAPVTIDETEDVMDEMADNGVESCDILGWEWEMGLHDTITERARRRGLDLRPRQIPREVMERQVTEADAVRFFELAHVDLDVRRQGSEACVVLKDFAIPSEELIPPKVRERIESWVDLIDYWSVDFDYSDEVFHNQWQAYRTRETPTLLTQSGWHEYPEAGRYSIVVKIIDIFGNDTTKLAEVRIK